MKRSMSGGVIMHQQAPETECYKLMIYNRRRQQTADSRQQTADSRQQTVPIYCPLIYGAIKNKAKLLRNWWRWPLVCCSQLGFTPNIELMKCDELVRLAPWFPPGGRIPLQGGMRPTQVGHEMTTALKMFRSCFCRSRPRAYLPVPTGNRGTG